MRGCRPGQGGHLKITRQLTEETRYKYLASSVLNFFHRCTSIFAILIIREGRRCLLVLNPSWNCSPHQHCFWHYYKSLFVVSPPSIETLVWKTFTQVRRKLPAKNRTFWTRVKRKLTYYGHLSRKKNLNLTKCIVQGKPEGKRGRSRPRMAYMDDIR